MDRTAQVYSGVIWVEGESLLDLIRAIPRMRGVY